ncbi:hypothetical protein AB0451_38875 [Streptomyces sp. NPDC052000]|uniref:hypothetical protein n=1 Tax=Streptomyces sp. NPDC052000 TaxID=3155676 RepID=UPI00344D06A1
MMTSDGREQGGIGREAKSGAAIAAQRHRRQLVLAVGITAVIAAAATVLVVRQHDKDATVHTPDGARQAASRFVEELGSADMSNPTTRHAIVERVYAPADIEAKQTELDTGYTLANRAMGLDSKGRPPAGARFENRTMVAGTSLTTYTDTDATVAVWNCATVRRTGPAPIDETRWYTTSMVLTWVGGEREWRLRSLSEQPGPTPRPGQTQPMQ